MKDPIIEQYQQNASAAQTQFEKYERLVNVYSFWRLFIFILLLISICFSVKLESFALFVIVFVFLGGCFAWLVKQQSEFESLKKYFAALKAVNENEIASINDQGNIYSDGVLYGNEKHFYTSDLDIFGNASLYKFINRAATSVGNDHLATWLSAPAKRQTILNRQQAITELSGKNNWKLDVQARLLFSKDAKEDYLKKLFVYLETPLEMKGEKWLNTYCIIAPFILAALVILSFFYPLGSVTALVGLANLAIVFSRGSSIMKTSMVVNKIGDTLSNYAAVFERIEHEDWESDLCKQLALVVKADKGVSTSAKIKLLAALIEKFNYSSNMIVGALLNIFFLWNIRQTIAIQNWKRRYHQSLHEAFEIIGHFEALYSLAGLHINYPEWCFPEIAGGKGYTFIAIEIAHPLIKTKNRVSNDYELKDTFNIDIITGSNMAGKSTFLRTLGINAVLALSGAPVCAAEMEISVINVVTYMRIKDSLNESTSTFKAELDRLQMLLKAVDEEENVFFLIDEMLRGTNSVDKYLGSKAVIEQLIGKRGVGLVATHDLQIAELEKQYPDYIRNFYFDIQVKEGEMLFDYKLKHGECKTFNASILLRQIGIDIPVEK